MKIHHIAIWVDDLEVMRQFYTTYFNALSGEKYTNPLKLFSSYFISFKSAETSIELMQKPNINIPYNDRGHTKGLAHFSMDVGSKQQVDQLTDLFRKDGYTIVGEPRTTGDGYYESVILDPEGNYIELVGA